MSKNFLGTICAFLANVIFGFSFLFSSTALKTADIFILLSWRFFVAFAVMLLLWVTGIIKCKFKGKNFRWLLIMAVFQPFLYFIFEQYGLQFTNTAFSGVLLAVVPIAAMVLSSIFLKEKPTALQIVFSVISLIGVAVISIDGNSEGVIKPIGITCLLGAVITAAAFNLLSRKISGVFSAVERTFMMFLIGFIGFTLIAVFKFKGEYIPKMSEAIKDTSFLVSVIYLAVISSVAAFLIYNFATTHISVTRAASFSNIITVVSVLAGVLILKEDFGTVPLICSLLIIIGVIGVNAPKREYVKKEKSKE